MRLNTVDLLSMSTAYVEDGVLKKWRLDNFDEKNIHHILDVKYRKGEKLTESDIEYIKTLQNVIFVGNGNVYFLNFTGRIGKFG